MESSKALSRCLQHARESPYLRRKYNLRSTRHARQPQSSSRSFTSSTHQRALAPPTFSSQDELTRTGAKSITTPPPRPLRSSTARQDSVSAKALASLDKIIATQRAKAAGVGSPPKTSNYDMYGKTGTLFSKSSSSSPGSRTNPVKPGDSAPFDVRDMISALSIDRNPNMSMGLTPREQMISLRLKPTLGRTLDVDDSRNFSLTRAFQVLETRINKNGNNVRADERNQKFHVRAGQAKKIKRRARWRETFRQGFLGECARVRKMIKQGW